MRRAIFGAVFTVVAALAGAAWADWYEPARGSAERRALMDAIRPTAEKLFGKPVEFIVGELRVSGDVAFAEVVAQRPGGGQIDIHSTPGWRANHFFEDADNLSGQALLQRKGGRWVARYETFGATDVWWQSRENCAIWRAVIAEVCDGY